MCGIVAYIGKQEAYPIVVKGLKRLEYRGYDSSGVALSNNGVLNVYKRVGKVSNLEEFAATQNCQGHAGIGHTRWATHGEPSDVNSHPHTSMDGKIALIHNGIIENYDVLKKELLKNGYVFKSETDTEVVVHLVDYIQKKENVWFGEALRLALNHVVGAYAIVAMSSDYPNRLVAARKSSPAAQRFPQGQCEPAPGRPRPCRCGPRRRVSWQQRSRLHGFGKLAIWASRLASSRSASVMIFTSSLNFTLGSQPSCFFALAGLPMSSSTSAGRS